MFVHTHTHTQNPYVAHTLYYINIYILHMTNHIRLKTNSQSHFPNNVVAYGWILM